MKSREIITDTFRLPDGRIVKRPLWALDGAPDYAKPVYPRKEVDREHISKDEWDTLTEREKKARFLRGVTGPTKE